MKNANYIILFAAFVIGIFLISNTFSFDAKSGNASFDKRLNEINKNALTDINAFKVCLEETYHANPDEVSNLLMQMEPAEVLLSYELAQMTSLSHAEVLEKYHLNSEKGWSTIFMSLGIKINSAQFKNLSKIYYDNNIENNSIISRK